ncbi:isoprenylcysteine alpha-carbonyl methylesterase ICME-like isoform X3 [Primulina huaijiensis]|uniref:isoprenylcysteine alpha-carbonyl methylesterase ICME-like isoform X3 n=1 Tax=Primulina huaijiensis TaxID=1492673 RepID=UPI003CC78238
MEATTSLPPVISSNNLVEQDPGSDSLFRASSFPSGSSDQRWRRRTSSLLARPTRQKSFGREVGHAAAETYLITGLSFKLLSYLGVGYRWITRLFSLVLYAMFLLPGFLQVGFCYFFSSHVHRSIVYGDRPRNRYKAWGSLLGLQLAERDIIVASIDYRNFPQGTISDMVDDISQGISYVCNNVVEFGGDPNKIYLMGQSAGAHISACALLQQAVKESSGDGISWSVSQIRAYFGLSGGYNLLKLVDHFHGRGLYRSVFLSIMEGEKSLKHFSPEIIAQSPGLHNAVPLLPHFVLFHGTSDYSIPSNESITFADTLRKAGARAELILYNGKTHTDLFLQDPLRGGKDELFDYVVTFIHSDDKEALASDAMASPRRRFVPEILLRLAREVSPF